MYMNVDVIVIAILANDNYPIHSKGAIEDGVKIHAQGQQMVIGICENHLAV